MVSTAEIKNMYSKEMTTNASTIYSAKIGLMYASDYGFAVSQKYWSLPGYNSDGEDLRKGISENWLYNGNKHEWIISKRSSSTYNVFSVNALGYVNGNGLASTSLAIRPTFNLLANVTYASGTGTASDPIRITV